jgi:hypothetical protein
VHLADKTSNKSAHGTERQRLNRINRWQLHELVESQTQKPAKLPLTPAATDVASG